LIVIEGGYLVASGAAAPGALLANTGPWTVTVDGAVTSTQDAGISLAAGNAKISTIQIDDTGEVGGDIGIFAQSSLNIVNAGVIGGGDNQAIFFQNNGNNSVTNPGLISSVAEAI